MLSEGDQAFLAALAGGETAAGYARKHNYSRDWAKWKSREVRRKLGVETIGEAVAMAEDNDRVGRADFDKLTGLVAGLREAVEDLAKAKPGQETQQQQQVVREREWDLKDHAKALGLSLEDVEKLKGEKEYERFKQMQDRLEQERLEEDDVVDDDNGGGKGLADVIRDGLGGVKHAKAKP